MLHGTRELKGMEVRARDGEVGKVRDAYFDDEHWTLRYVVVQAGGWLAGRQVLLSPHSVQRIDRDAGRLEVNLTREQVRNAPGIDTDMPVSRQQERAQYDYYGYPYYWSGPALWGPVAYPLAPVPAYVPPGAPPAERGEGAAAAAQRERESNPHLRSANEVSGYAIEARDGSIGHVEGFLFDTDSWRIRHALVDTRDWLPGRKVLLEPDSIEAVDWSQRHVRLKMSRDQVKSAPQLETVI